MSEKSVIKNTIEVITKDRIIYDLQAHGILETDTLLVHSSLSSIGFVVGREMAVVEALLEVVIDGALVMPSHTSDNTDPELWVNPPVPETWFSVIKEYTPSYNKHTFSTREMGRIVECFRHYPKVHRSNHPTCSFIARGKNAYFITKNHQLTPAFGYKSPLGKLYELDAKVLLMGVGYDKSTSFHLAEVLSNTLSMVKQGTKVNGKWVEFEDLAYDTADFQLLGETLEDRGIAQRFKVGQAESILFDMKEMIDFAVLWFDETRNKTEE